MKKGFASLLIIFPFLIFAQKSTGTLTVFSEDGLRFFLILNGEKQNDKAQTNIRVEELAQPYYSAKIIFEDSAIATVSKNVQVTDADNKMMDVTYRMRRDKNGKTKLNLYSAIEATPDFTAPQGMYVRKFGRPSEVIETTTTGTSNSMDANVNMAGISMNVTINDPGTVVTHTTTTTTTHESHGSTINNDGGSSAGANNCRGWAMKQTDFADAKKTISDASFEATKLSTAKSITTANCLSSEQITAVCKLFSFEESKLDFAKFAYKYCIDPKNYFKVNNVFSFDASKEELSRFTGGE